MSEFAHPLHPETPATTARSHGRRIDRLERRSHGPWHNVGDAGEPAFGVTVTQAAGYVATRFRRRLGGGCEIQIAVDGGSDGDVVFTIPAGYFIPLNGKIPLGGHDSTGAYRAFHVDQTTGDVVLGI